MKIGVVKEGALGEKRVALVPADIPALRKAADAAPGSASVQILVETGAGTAAGYTDDAYREKGATITSRGAVLSGADLLLAVRAGAANPQTGASDARALKEGATLIGLLEPWAPDPALAILAQRKIRTFSMERIPRITRAQSMDVLSSQANLAGYRAALMAAQELPRMFPMMMTSAGTLVPARVFVVGVGVAGLQAIATAKRLGAVVSAYDVRSAVKEQVHSLGARFVEMTLDADETESAGGYAREMSEEFYRRQREMMSAVVRESDVVITTAAVPGKRAPVLVTAEMVAGMKPGSVVVDLAAERGGNCELTRPGECVPHGGVRVMGPVNVASTIAFHASQLFSRNIVTLLGELIRGGGASAGETSFPVDYDDEIVRATLILDQGGCPDSALATLIGVSATQGASHD